MLCSPSRDRAHECESARVRPDEAGARACEHSCARVRRMPTSRGVLLQHVQARTRSTRPHALARAHLPRAANRGCCALLAGLDERAWVVLCLQVAHLGAGDRDDVRGRDLALRGWAARARGRPSACARTSVVGGMAQRANVCVRGRRHQVYFLCLATSAPVCEPSTRAPPHAHARARARWGGGGGGGEGEGGGTGGPRIARKRTHHGQAAPFLFIPPAHHPARVGALAPLDRQRLAEHRGRGPGGGGQRQRHGGREGRGRAHGAPRVHPCVRAGTLRAACAVATPPPRPTHPYPPALRRALRRPVAPPTSVGRGTPRGTKSRNRCRGTYPRESIYRAYITSM